MRVTVVHPAELGVSEAQLWAKFQELSPATLNPFLSFTFTRIVGQARPGARVAVIENAGRIEAFLPYEIQRDSIAGPIGWPFNELQGIIGSGVSIDVRSIVKKAGLRGWRFDQVPAEQRSLIPFHYDGTNASSSIIDLKCGYPEYFKSRAKKVTRRIAEQKRAIERKHGPLSFAWADTDLKHLHKLIEWKCNKYDRMRSIFSEPATVQIAEELAVTSNGDCTGIMSVLSVGEQAIAAHLGLLEPRGLCAWLPSYDWEFSRFSPGMVMWLALAEEASARGVRRIELGYGTEPYKLRLANDSYTIAAGVVWASRLEALARSAYRRFYYNPVRRGRR